MTTGLKDLASSLTKAAGDLCSLEVKTFTGAIEHTYKTTTDNGQETKTFSWDKIAENATDTGVSMHLVLATKVNIDGDSTHFATSGHIDELLLKTHAEAVKTGSEYRSQIINFLAGKFIEAVS